MANRGFIACCALAAAYGASACVFFPTPTFVPSDGALDARGDVGPIDAADAQPSSDVVADGPPLDAACAPGRFDCDRDAANGCEVSESVNHCGGCERACALPSATAACVDGQCRVNMCVAGFGDCDRDPSNGCEERLDNAAHCGACGRSCSGATPVCAGGSCATGCGPGLSRCGGLCVETQNNDAHCGSCGAVCSPVSNGQRRCEMSACVLRCNPGFANCDGDASNGCETPLGTNTNCGACGASCAAGRTCNTATGTCTASCAGTDCSGVCVDVSTSLNNCGSCGNSCPTRANATPSCAMGRCESACVPGYSDCDANATNGCEAQLSSSAAHCGACGRACSFSNASASCVSGACVMGACNAGFADCDANPANGCEVDTRSSPMNCGACRAACALANATSTCVAGVCRIASCTPPFGNCDGVESTGCERSLTTIFACGMCGVECPRPSVSCRVPRCEFISREPICTCGE
jgi:hypothetical protein